MLAGQPDIVVRGALRPFSVGVPPADQARQRQLAALSLSCPAVMVITLLAVVPGHPAVSPRVPRAADDGGLVMTQMAQMPMSSQAAISTAIGSDAARFHPDRSGPGEYRVEDVGGLAVAFYRSGGLVKIRGKSLSLALAATGRDRVLRGVTASPARVHGNSVVYDRGWVVESYLAGPLGLEQAFTVSRRPGVGDLALAVTVSGGSLHGPRPERLCSRGAMAPLCYATVASKQVTRAGDRSERGSPWRQGDCSFVSLDRHAAYPLRIDPLLQVARLAPSDAGGLMHFL